MRQQFVRRAKRREDREKQMSRFVISRMKLGAAIIFGVLLAGAALGCGSAAASQQQQYVKVEKPGADWNLTWPSDKTWAGSGNTNTVKVHETGNAYQATRYMNDMLRAAEACDKAAYDHALANLQALRDVARKKGKVLTEQELNDYDSLTLIINHPPAWNPNCGQQTATAPEEPKTDEHADHGSSKKVGESGEKTGASHVQAGPKMGTREDTEAIAKDAEDAYTKYQAASAPGTSDEKHNSAFKELHEKKTLVQKAMAAEAFNAKEVREALDDYNHYNAAYDRLKANPDSSASDTVKAQQDMDKAYDKYQKAYRKNYSKIETDIKGKYDYGEAVETAEPDKGQKKKKGSLDFLGDVSVGFGVGGGHHEGHCGGHHGGKSKGKKPRGKGCGQSHQGCTPHGSGCVPGGTKTPENKSVPHGCGCGPH